MTCTNCHADISAWLLKYKSMPKIRLDDMYFKDEKLPSKWDEVGLYISGEKFYEHESKKCFERCPKCGSKGSMDDNPMYDVWSSIQ
jgi:hypothetical protein